MDAESLRCRRQRGEKTKAINQGPVREEDIKNNDAVDALATKGADGHKNIDRFVNAAIELGS